MELFHSSKLFTLKYWWQLYSPKFSRILQVRVRPHKTTDHEKWTNYAHNGIVAMAEGSISYKIHVPLDQKF